MSDPKYINDNISVKRTRAAFKDALFDLVATVPFKSVSVQDLVTKSGYSRSTFYLHFHDKYNLSEWAINDEADEYVKTVYTAITENIPVNNDESMYETCYMILKQQMDKRAFYDALIHKRIPGYSTNAFADKTYLPLMKIFDYPSFYWNAEIDREFYYFILTNSLIDQIRFWERKGYSHSLEEMAKQARALHNMWGFDSVMLK